MQKKRFHVVCEECHHAIDRPRPRQLFHPKCISRRGARTRESAVRSTTTGETGRQTGVVAKPAAVVTLRTPSYCHGDIQSTPADHLERLVHGILNDNATFTVPDRAAPTVTKPAPSKPEIVWDGAYWIKTPVES
jgi:hypothetical protein